MTTPVGSETVQTDLSNTEKINELNTSEDDYLNKVNEENKIEAGSQSTEPKNVEILKPDGFTQKIKSNLEDPDRSEKSSILTKTNTEKNNETVSGLISKQDNGSFKKSNGSKLKRNQILKTNKTINAGPENSGQSKGDRRIKNSIDLLAHTDRTTISETDESQEIAVTKEVANSPTRADILVSNLPFKNKEINHTKANFRFSTAYPYYTNPLPVLGIGADEVSLSAGTIYESGKIENERGKDFRGSNEFRTNNSWQVGLTLNKGISKNLYFSAGLGFKHFDIINDISQSISFGNRRPKPGGMPFEHEFPFKLLPRKQTCFLPMDDLGTMCIENRNCKKLNNSFHLCGKMKKIHDFIKML